MGKVVQQPQLQPQVVTEENLQSIRGHLMVSMEGQEVVFRDVLVLEWYAPYVASVLQSGIASGYRDAEGNLKGEYGPANPVTYAEIAKMTLESSGNPITTGNTRNVTTQEHWASPYIFTAEQLHFAAYERRLNVDAPASRGAVMQTIVDALPIRESLLAETEDNTTVSGTGAVATGSGTVATGSGAVLTGSGATLSGAAIPVVEEEETVMPVTFRDVPEGSEYAEAILLMAELGIVSGDTDRQGNPKGTFRPNAPINRAEVAKIFSKLIELEYIK